MDSKPKVGMRVVVSDALGIAGSRASGKGTVDSWCTHSNEADDLGIRCNPTNPDSRFVVKMDGGGMAFPDRTQVEGV